MKKHVIALAVASAVTMPAVAQVTVSGTLDTSMSRTTRATPPAAASGDFRLDGTRDQAATATATISEVSNSFWSTSNINFKGSEDLGGGIKASFHVEGGVNTDVGTSDLANRVSQVQLSGAFGTVNLGRGSTALNDAATSGGHGLGNFANLPFLAPSRPNNAINYITPSFNGISARVTIGEGESTGPTTASNSDYSAASLHGRVGAFSFVVGQASAKQQRVASTGRAFVFNSTNSALSIGAVQTFSTDGATGLYTTTFPAVGTRVTTGTAVTLTTISVGAATASVDGKTKDSFLAASYNFGFMRAHGQMLRSKSNGAVADGRRVQMIDRKIWGVSLVAPMGASTLFVNYQDHDRSGDRTTTTGTGSIYQLSTSSPNDKSTVAAFGVNYALSKRTNAYIVYRDIDNSAGSDYLSGVNGQDANATAIGVRHSF